MTCHGNQHAVAENDSQAIERVTDAHKPHLLMVVQLKHVVAVGGNVVGGTGESHQEEEGHSALEPEGSVQRKSHTRQRRAQQQLHGQHPPALGAIEVDKGTPQRLDDPRQSQPAGIEGNVCVCQSQLHIHDYGHRHHHHVGQSFGDIKGRYPRPRISMFHKVIFVAIKLIYFLDFGTTVIV